ncbi:MAG: hypothetical protein HYV27_07700 [Candidatus Hydrogenedentes bacterium]|nr:hypothetical protein [Candidatus Hydrogenedentota bacterium]
MYLSVLGSPWTLLPMLAGSTLFVASWILGIRPDLGMLAGLTGALGAAGMFFTTLILRGESFARRALDDFQADARNEREAQLDRLEAQLQADEDPRTDAALRDLRSLTAAFEVLTRNEDGEAGQALLINVHMNVLQMFEQAVRSLEQSYALWQTIQDLSTREAREPLWKKRENVVNEILLSIRQLGALLASLQDSGSIPGGPSDLAQVREELEQSLRVAKQTGARLRAFEQDLRTGAGE